jgi:hypothetical protein
MKTPKNEPWFGATAFTSVNDKLPRPGQWVMVEAPSVRCLGFLDPERGWRDVRDGHMIENVRSWCLIDADQRKTDASPTSWRTIPYTEPPVAPFPT